MHTDLPEVEEGTSESLHRDREGRGFPVLDPGGVKWSQHVFCPREALCVTEPVDQEISDYSD